MVGAIVVRFIRESDLASASAAAAENDDIARITNVGPDLYSLTYTRNGVVSLSLSGDDVFRWFRRQIRMLETRDVDPYAAIQLDFPGFQSLLVRVRDLNREYDTILDALDFTLDHWPGSPAKEPTCRRHYIWLD